MLYSIVTIIHKYCAPTVYVILYVQLVYLNVFVSIFICRRQLALLSLLTI